MNKPSLENVPAATEDQDAPLGIVALWRLLWSNKWKILAPGVALAILVGALVFRAADTFTAEAQLLLSRGNLEIVELETVAGTEITQGALTNALTILGSRSLALQVMERLDLLNDPEVNPNIPLPGAEAPEEFFPEAAVRQYALDWLAAMTSINVLPGSNAIVIRATTTSPVKSANIANAYVDSYLDYQVQRGQSETARAAAALETRVNELRLRLEEDQAQLQAYRAGAPSIATDSAESLASEAVNIRTRLATIDEDLQAVESAMAALDAVSSGDFDALREAVAQNAILSRFEQSVLRRAVAPETAVEDASVLLTALRGEQSRLARLSTALRDGQAALEQRLDELNDFTVGLRQLEVEVETTSQVYEASLGRLKELAIQTGLRDAGAQVLARAEAPLRTDAQGRRRMVAIAGVLGVFMGIAYVLLREAANDRVRKLSDLVDITGGSTVVQLPAAKYGVPRGRHTLTRSEKQKTSHFQESVRSLRHRLLSGSDQPNVPLVIGVLSSLPSEGKTTITRSLAQSFAKIDRKVMVVDGDMRVGKLSKDLGVPADGPGLHEVIADKLDPARAIVSLKDEGFDLLPSGRVNSDSSDLLLSQRFVDLVAALRERYDVVLFDTPPILVLPDAPKIAAQMNALVLVAEYDRTPLPAIRDSVAALQAHRVAQPVVAFCNAPKAFGQNYGFPDKAYSRYFAGSA